MIDTLTWSDLVLHTKLCCVTNNFCVTNDFCSRTRSSSSRKPTASSFRSPGEPGSGLVDVSQSSLKVVDGFESGPRAFLIKRVDLSVSRCQPLNIRDALCARQEINE